MLQRCSVLQSSQRAVHAQSAASRPAATRDRHTAQVSPPSPRIVCSPETQRSTGVTKPARRHAQQRPRGRATRRRPPPPARCTRPGPRATWRWACWRPRSSHSTRRARPRGAAAAPGPPAGWRSSRRAAGRTRASRRASPSAPPGRRRPPPPSPTRTSRPAWSSTWRLCPWPSSPSWAPALPASTRAPSTSCW